MGSCSLDLAAARGGTMSYRPTDSGTAHLCFLVADIHAVDARLRKAGVKSRSNAPVEITAGPNRGSWAVYFEDPDGFPIEFIQRSADQA